MCLFNPNSTLTGFYIKNIKAGLDFCSIRECFNLQSGTFANLGSYDFHWQFFTYLFYPLSLSLSLSKSWYLCVLSSPLKGFFTFLFPLCVASHLLSQLVFSAGKVLLTSISLMLEHSCLHPSLHHRHSPIKVCNNDHRHYIRRPSPSLHAASKWRNQMIKRSVVDLY